MIGRVFNHLRYLRLLFLPRVWRWFYQSIKFLIMDHLEPWSELERQPHSMIHPSVSFRSTKNIEIGSHTRIQDGCVLWASPKSKIKIGQYSGLGPGTKIFSSNHKYEPGVPYYEQPWNEADVTIGRDVWVGAGSVIVAGVTIGEGSVVAAGSVVTKDVPAGSVAAGVPAKIIKTR